MKNKVLIISDSNAVAIQQAITQDKVKVDFEIDYFVLGGRSAVLSNKVEIVDNKLVSSHPGVVAQMKLCKAYDEGISLAPYSHIILHGFGLLSSADGGDWIMVVDDQDKYLSAAALNATPSIKDNIKRPPHFAFAEKLSQVAGVTIASVAAPLPNAKHPAWKNVMGQRVSPLPEYELQAREVLAPLNVKFVSCPKQLLATNSYCVDPKFWVGKPVDFSHLNAMGGAILIAHVFNELQLI